MLHVLVFLNLFKSGGNPTDGISKNDLNMGMQNQTSTLSNSCLLDEPMKYNSSKEEISNISETVEVEGASASDVLKDLNCCISNFKKLDFNYKKDTNKDSSYDFDINNIDDMLILPNLEFIPDLEKNEIHKNCINKVNNIITRYNEEAIQFKNCLVDFSTLLDTIIGDIKKTKRSNITQEELNNKKNFANCAFEKYHKTFTELNFFIFNSENLVACFVDRVRLERNVFHMNAFIDEFRALMSIWNFMIENECGKGFN